MLTRGSHQSPISAAWRLVSEAANRQPALPVQAISPARICDASTASPTFLIAAKVDVGEDVAPVEGYHLFTGGGFGPDADVGQEVYHDLKAEDAPKTVERLLKAY